MKPTRALAYARHHRPRFLAELKEFLRFRSVSSQPERARDVAKCAQWLAIHLRHIGLDHVQIIPANGTARSNPIVYGAWQHAPGQPTLLIYGHYDVLPGEPTEIWNTPPFTPVVIGNDLYARGSSDDKGPLFCHIKACESFLATERALPVNIKCIFEGEEEVGSPHLPSFIARNRDGLLKTDFTVDLGKVSYHVPCHSRVQKIGRKTEEMFKLIGQKVSVLLNTVERCSGHAGTYGVKTAYFDNAMKIGKPVFKAMAKDEPDYISSDCALAGHHIAQGMARNGLADTKPAAQLAHPLSLMRIAYGLE